MIAHTLLLTMIYFFQDKRSNKSLLLKNLLPSCSNKENNRYDSKIVATYFCLKWMRIFFSYFVDMTRLTKGSRYLSYHPINTFDNTLLEPNFHFD